jgi:hypothetical protein
MRFKEIYFTEEFERGDVIIADDKNVYVIKKINDDGTYEVVDKDTLKKFKILNKSDIIGLQTDLFGSKHSTEAPEHKKYKLPKKLGKPEKVQQQSLF